MAQVMVVEPDELVVTSLEKAFKGDEEVKLNFAKDFASAMEILNGNPLFKDVYGKGKALYEAAKEEFLEATRKEVAAKTAAQSAQELLEKYENNIETITDGEADPKKAAKAPAAPAAAPVAGAAPPVEAPPEVKTSEVDEQKQNLIKEIARLTNELKSLKQVLMEATKVKSEKEKIAQDKQVIADLAKAKIPSEKEEIYNVLVISSALLLPSVTKWVENFEKTLTFQPNKEIKIIVLGFESDEKNVKKYLNQRISDYMIKPVDELLARQNVKFLALTDKKPKSEVYSLQIKEPVDVVYEYEIESIAESSFLINSTHKFVENEFRAFNCDLFLRKGQKSVLAKCLTSVEKTGGGFLSEFWFIGMDTHLSFQIKNVIKNAPKL